MSIHFNQKVFQFFIRTFVDRVHSANLKFKGPETEAECRDFNVFSANTFAVNPGFENSQTSIQCHPAIMPPSLLYHFWSSPTLGFLLLCCMSFRIQCTIPSGLPRTKRFPPQQPSHQRGITVHCHVTRLFLQTLVTIPLYLGSEEWHSIEVWLYFKTNQLLNCSVAAVGLHVKSDLYNWVASVNKTLWNCFSIKLTNLLFDAIY